MLEAVLGPRPPPGQERPPAAGFCCRNRWSQGGSWRWHLCQTTGFVFGSLPRQVPCRPAEASLHHGPSGAQHCARRKESRGSEVSWWEWPREASAPGDRARVCVKKRAGHQCHLSASEATGEAMGRSLALEADSALGGPAPGRAKPPLRQGAGGSADASKSCEGPGDRVPRARQQKPPC